MTPIILSGSDPDIYCHYVDISALGGEVYLHDTIDEPEMPVVRTLLAYTPDDAVRVAERLLAAARTCRVEDDRQGEIGL